MRNLLTRTCMPHMHVCMCSTHIHEPLISFQLEIEQGWSPHAHSHSPAPAPSLASALPPESATEGDSFIVAFFSASHALAFAQDLQLGLLLLPWPEELLRHPSCTPVWAVPKVAGKGEAGGGMACVSGTMPCYCFSHDEGIFAPV